MEHICAEFFSFLGTSHCSELEMFTPFPSGRFPQSQQLITKQFLKGEIIANIDMLFILDAFL